MAFAVKAQDIRFYAHVDKNPVRVGDVFTYQITLENARGEITPPSFSDFAQVSGAMQSSSSTTINSKQTTKHTIAYRIRADREGEFTIREASAYINGITYHTEPITIKVQKGSSSPTQSSRQGGVHQTTTADQNLILQIQLSKHKAYLGEQITAQYVLLTRYRNFDLENYEFPNIPGFWVEEQRRDQLRWEPEYEIINGVGYRKIILKQQILFPQRTGKLQIDNFEVTGRVNRSFFHPGEQVVARSSSPTIEVLALPPSPDSFNGAVGKFNFEATTDRNDVSTNDAINLKITISGSGNLKLINEPIIDFPSDFETYDPETKDNINVLPGGMSGSRSFHYLLIPRYAGNYEIPKIEFTYFDPQQQKFITLSKGPFAIDVEGISGISSPVGSERMQSEITQSREDIKFITTDGHSLISIHHSFFRSVGYYLGVGMPFLGFVIFIFLRKRRATLLDDVEGTRKRKANRMARKRLRLASKALKENDSKTFYAEIFQALYGYLSDKLGISQSLLSKPIITEYLVNHQVNKATIDELTEVIETCEMARFAAVKNTTDADFYEQTVKLISKLDNALK